MSLFEKNTNSQFAFWIGDKINSNLHISTKQDLTKTLYSLLSNEARGRVTVEFGKYRLSEVAQVYLDTATGSTDNLFTTLYLNLKHSGSTTPYSYLEELDSITTVITHDHSNMIDEIWKNEEVRTVFNNPKSDSTKKVFKLLGSYDKKNEIILTSQNIRRVKLIKSYQWYWNSVAQEIKEKDLVLLGVDLCGDSMEFLEFILDRVKEQNGKRYFVSNQPLNSIEELWLRTYKFEVIAMDDFSFISKFYSAQAGKELELEREKKASTTPIETHLVSTLDKELKKPQEVEEEIKEEEITDSPIEESVELEKEIQPLEAAPVIDEEVLEVVQDQPIEEVLEVVQEEELVVENLDIPTTRKKDTLIAEILEGKTNNRNIRLTEFRKGLFPSYKIDDFSEFENYKAYQIKLPFSSQTFPKIEQVKRDFSGKVLLSCGDITLRNISLKSFYSNKNKVIELKTIGFQLTLLLNSRKIEDYFFKVSDTSVSIKSLNFYKFLQNFFNGSPLNVKSKKNDGIFTLTRSKNLEDIAIIIKAIENFLDIKKFLPIKDISITALIQNIRSLEVLKSFYTNKGKVTKGNVTIRTISDLDIEGIKKLVIRYRIWTNFMNTPIQFIEDNEVDLSKFSISKDGDHITLEGFDVTQKITYTKVD